MMTCQPPSFDQVKTLATTELWQRWNMFWVKKKIWIDCRILSQIGTSNVLARECNRLHLAGHKADEAWENNQGIYLRMRTPGHLWYLTDVQWRGASMPPMWIVRYINGVISGVHLWGSCWGTPLRSPILSSWGLCRCANMILALSEALILCSDNLRDELEGSLLSVYDKASMPFLSSPIMPTTGRGFTPARSSAWGWPISLPCVTGANLWGW